ncbi:MAG: hypothetical protein HY290_11915 [Planctomycetia bacterium]|nr:hypothetical protein [Planctomycetia bacterium]
MDLSPLSPLCPRPSQPTCVYERFSDPYTADAARRGGGMCFTVPERRAVDLPVRFQCYEELSESQKEERYHNFHFVNLKGTDLKPLLRDKFRPVLKTSGFGRISDSLAIRVVEPHYVHCLQLTFSSKQAGRFFVRGGIALDFLPLSKGSEFTPKGLRLDTDCLFTKDMTLPNGNPEFDNGTDLAEADQTIDYLVSSFRDFDRDYFSRFVHFPSPLDSLGVDFVRNFASLIARNSASEYGTWGATEKLFTLRLAMVHVFLGNTSPSRQLLEYGLANYELLGLKTRYEQLLRELL